MSFMIDHILSSTRQIEKRLSLQVINSNTIRQKERHIQLCSHCMKSFDRLSLLIRHIRIHTSEKPYICDISTKNRNASPLIPENKKTEL
ncbi:unnamed protein product [Rotaria sp. Silwood2]|nr:unnamed protein product [Rotaria sp. Silwood2]